MLAQYFHRITFTLKKVIIVLTIQKRLRLYKCKLNNKCMYVHMYVNKNVIFYEITIFKQINIITSILIFNIFLKVLEILYFLLYYFIVLLMYYYILAIYMVSL